MSARSGLLLGVEGLTKFYGDFAALKGASLTIGRGEIVALCGGNGAGKSTLVKILTGVVQPSRGTIAVEGRAVSIRNPVEAQRLGLALVAQELSLAPDLSVHDNLWLGHAGAPLRRRTAETRARAARALDEVGLVGLDLDEPVRGLGLGERQLVEIARGLVRDATLLILDEPTATLSAAEIDRVFAAVRALRERGRSVIFITHRLGEVFDLCERVIVMRNGEVVVDTGLADVRREQLVEWMLGRPLDEIYPGPGGPPGPVVLDVGGLTIPGVVRHLSIQCRAGEILGIVGQIGSGATEAMRALAGLDHRAEGRLDVQGRTVPMGHPPAAAAAGIQFVSEDRAAEGIFLRLGAGTNLTATRISDHARWGLVGTGALRRAGAIVAASVGLDAGRLGHRADQLSGGNQQKLAVGRCAGRAARCVLLLNEPTRGVDMGARAEIYRLLRRFGTEGHAVVLASTDMEEVLGLADRVVTMFRGEVVGQHHRGAYDEARILTEISHARLAA